MPRVQRPAVGPKRSAWNKGHLVGPKRPFCHNRCGQFVFASNLWETYATLPFSMLQTIATRSFTASMRNLRDASNVSDIKSNDQRWSGRRASGMGVVDPRARLRPLRRLTPSFRSLIIPIAWASLKRPCRICLLLRRVSKLYIKVREVSGGGSGGM